MYDDPWGRDNPDGMGDYERHVLSPNLEALIDYADWKRKHMREHPEMYEQRDPGDENDSKAAA